MNTELLYDLYTAISDANRHEILRTMNMKNILEGNQVAKNIYVALTGDAMIKNGGFDSYLYEIKFGKITHAKVKQSFKEVGFTAGWEILNRASKCRDLAALDLEYYRLEPDLEKTLMAYAEKEWDEAEFVAYRNSISFEG